MSWYPSFPSDLPALHELSLDFPYGTIARAPSPDLLLQCHSQCRNQLFLSGNNARQCCRLLQLFICVAYVERVCHNLCRPLSNTEKFGLSVRIFVSMKKIISRPSSSRAFSINGSIRFFSFPSSSAFRELI